MVVPTAIIIKLRAKFVGEKYFDFISIALFIICIVPTKIIDAPTYNAKYFITLGK